MIDNNALEVTNPLGVLGTMKVKRFTIFEDETFDFSPALNIIVGENGAGKTHLLKLAYAVTKVLYPERGGRSVDVEEIPVALTKKLRNIFLSDDLGRLRHHVKNGKPGTARVSVSFQTGNDSGDNQLKFEITGDKRTVEVLAAPKARPATPIGGPVYLPPREVISLVPEFVADYERTSIRFEETYYDLAKLLIGRPKRGPLPDGVTELLEPLEKAIGGSLEADDQGRLYVKFKKGPKIEAPLVSEGYRKIATLAYLIYNGSLALHGTVFWDEPEANLNPRMMGPLAKTLVLLASSGVQLFIATHSLFLMREVAFHLDRHKGKGKAIPARYFSLDQQEGGLRVQNADDIDGLGIIASLDAALKQDDAIERLYWEAGQ